MIECLPFLRKRTRSSYEEAVLDIILIEISQQENMSRRESTHYYNKHLRQSAYKKEGLFWLTVLEVQAMIGGPCCFGSVVRQNIMTGVHGKTKPLTS
jgi:hypothetical protein